MSNLPAYTGDANTEPSSKREETSDGEPPGPDESSDEEASSDGKTPSGPTRTALGALRAMLTPPPEPPSKDSPGPPS